MFHEIRVRTGGDWRWTLGVAVAGLLCLACCRADDRADVEPPTGEEQAGGRPNRLLLLVSGRIVEGRISQTAGGYMVDRPTGSMLVPFGHVRLEATDRRDAYRKLRKTMPRANASQHIALARWCSNQKLLDEARGELRDALMLEPDRGEARSMLRRLEEAANPQKPIHLTRPTLLLRTPDGFQPQEVESLAGLSRGSALQFVSKIQPILMNKCATAGCHGPRARNEFRLTRVRAGRGSHRVFVERNLAAVLRYVDVDDPERSPLLVAPRGSHGGGSRAVFSGTRGPDQAATLRGWVRQVAGERAGDGGKESTRRGGDAETRGDAGVALSRPRIPTGGAGPTGSAGPASDLRTPSPRTQSREDDLLDRILREQRKDAFDPEAFNRMVHGKENEGQ